MSDTLPPAQRSYNMSLIRSRNTTPERAVRHTLWHKGYRYRPNDKRLPGSPDLVLPKYRAVIFINGCFWHGHRGCTKYVGPKTNAGFWKEKIARNIVRDELNAQRLDTLAWTVITVWECELDKNTDAAIARIEADLRAAKDKYDKWTALRISAHVIRIPREQLQHLIPESKTNSGQVPDKVISKVEALTRYGISETWLYRKTRGFGIRSSIVGGKTYFPKKDLDRLFPPKYCYDRKRWVTLDDLERTKGLSEKRILTIAAEHDITREKVGRLLLLSLPEWKKARELISKHSRYYMTREQATITQATSVSTTAFTVQDYSSIRQNGY